MTQEEWLEEFLFFAAVSGGITGDIAYRSDPMRH